MVWHADRASRDYDARGLVELDGTRPAGRGDRRRRARVIDAASLTTRKVNLELRWLLYEQGVRDVTVHNPGALHSLGVGDPDPLPDHLRGQPRLLRVRAHRRPRGPHHRPRRLVGVREHDVRASSSSTATRARSTAAALRGGDVVVKGRVGARTGIDQKGGTIIVVGDAGSMTGFMMQRGRQIICGDVGPGPRRLDVRRDDLRRRARQVARRRLRARASGPTPTPSSSSASSASTGSARRPSCRSSCAARSSTTTTRSSRPSASWCSDGRRERPRPPHVLGRSRIFTPEVINDIHMKAELGRYRMRGFSMFKKIPHWDDLMFLPGTLTRFVIEGYREKCETKTVLGARFAREAARARHPDLHHGHELRRAVARGQDGPGQGRLDGGHRDLLGRGRDDPARARPVDQVVLPGHPEPVRVQPAPPDARRRDRVLHRPGLQGRARRPPDGPEGHRAGGRDALAAGRHRPALAGAPPGLARARRPVAEDPGDPRGDQLRGPDPAQAGRRARVRRRAHGGQVRARTSSTSTAPRAAPAPARTSPPRRPASR